MSNGRRGDNRGNRRQSFKNREREKALPEQQEKRGKKAEDGRSVDARIERNRESGHERPRWVPPKVSVEPLPVPDCPYCGKPIKELSTAMSDRNTGEAIHFDCLIARLSQGENLEPGETVAYIGGGRFGVVRFNNTAGNASAARGFIIKKIVEWENKENRAEWRQTVSEHFSVT